EAFAQPSEIRPPAPPVVPKQPPGPIEEVPPDQKPAGDNVIWLPGYWAWDDDRTDFIWVSGFWRDVPPDRTWIPGFWQQAEGGWQWVSGYWSSAEQVQETEYLPAPPDSIEAGPSTPAPDA